MRAALALLALLLAPAAEAAPRLFVSTERPFTPDTPGAVVKLEVRGSGSVDVRLYRLQDPEKFFATQPALERPRLDGKGKHPAPRAQRGVGRLRDLVARAERDLVRAPLTALTPAARELLAGAVAAPRPPQGTPVPFLQGLELVERWDLACGGAEAGNSFCDLDIGPRRSGVYLVEAVYGRDVAHALAIVTRLGAVVRRTDRDLTVLVVDSRTGAPVPNAAVAVLGAGGPVRGTTNKSGLLTLRASSRRTVVLVQQGPDVAVVESQPFTAPPPDRHVLVMTDRGLYRPGERVVFHGFARTGEDRLSLPRDERARVSLYDGRGALLLREELPLSEQGGFGDGWALPELAAPGLFSLVAEVDGKSGAAELLVRQTPEPDFALTASLDVVRAGAKAAATVAATRDGAALPGVVVSWRATRSPLGPERGDALEEVDRGEATTGKDGRAAFAFETAPDDASYAVQLLGRDGEGRVVTAHAESVALRGAAHVTLSTERRLSLPNVPLASTLCARTAAGAPYRASFVVRGALAVTGGKAARAVFSREVATDASGCTAFTFTPGATGYYELEASDRAGRLADTFVYVTAEGGDIPFSPEALTLVTDKDSYAPGDSGHLLILAPFETGTALVTVEGAESGSAEAVAIKASSALFRFKVTPALGAAFGIGVQAIAGERTWRAERSLLVSPQLERLAVKPAWTGLETEDGRLAIDVADAAGKPAAGAELFVVVRDAAALRPATPDLHAFFHPLPWVTGTTAGSTTFRSGSAGERLALSDGVAEEGYLPFKVLPAAQARPADEGLLHAERVIADARGHALLRVALQPSVRTVAVSIAGLAGSAAGVFAGTFPRAVPAAELVAPVVVRADDRPVLRASLDDPRGAYGVTLAYGSALARSEAGPGHRTLTLPASPCAPCRARAGFGELGTLQAAMPPATPPARSLGAALVGPQRVRPPAGATHGELVAVGPSMAIPILGSYPRVELPALTETAFALALHEVALARARGAVPGQPPIALAHLNALARPEGGFGAFDGAARDVRLSSLGAVVLLLAEQAGLDVEEGTASRTLLRLLESDKARAEPATAWALALAGEPVLHALGALADKPDATPEQLAFALLAVNATQEAEKERLQAALAARLEAALKASGPTASVGDGAATDASRAIVRATALAVLALEGANRRAPLLAPALRFLALERLAGPVPDLATGLAELALASGAHLLPPAKVTALVESPGHRARAVALRPSEAAGVELPADASLTVPSGFAVALFEAPPRAAVPVRIRRTVRPLGADGAPVERPVRRGDRVRVELELDSDSPLGPVQLVDGFEGALAPVAHRGAPKGGEPELRFWPTKVSALLLELPAGKTTIGYAARVRLAGTFHSAAPELRTTAGAVRGTATELLVEEGGP